MNDVLEIVKYTQDVKLLYVEDDEDSQTTTIYLLEEFFEKIIVAKNGEDGLDKFKNNEIDLILTDIAMPKLNGLEMTKRIREVDEDIPILVLSAHNESEYLESSIKMGVEGYIFKPIEMGQFASTIYNVLQKTKLKNEIKKDIYE